MGYTNVSQHTGGGVAYYDGQRERHINASMLKEIRSRVVTHEGEVLGGKEGRKYMDNHSKKCLGKDLSGSYNATQVRGFVK